MEQILKENGARNLVKKCLRMKYKDVSFLDTFYMYKSKRRLCKFNGFYHKLCVKRIKGLLDEKESTIIKIKVRKICKMLIDIVME